MAVSWLINGGDPNYLLTGMILQVVTTIYTHLKSNIDTQNDAVFERGYIFQTIILGIHVSFRECKPFKPFGRGITLVRGLTWWVGPYLEDHPSLLVYWDPYLPS